MNSSGAVGGILSPILIGFVVQHFATWTAPLYFTGLLYVVGALCWLGGRSTMAPTIPKLLDLCGFLAQSPQAGPA